MNIKSEKRETELMAVRPKKIILCLEHNSLKNLRFKGRLCVVFFCFFLRIETSIIKTPTKKPVFS